MHSIVSLLWVCVYFEDFLSLQYSLFEPPSQPAICMNTLLLSLQWKTRPAVNSSSTPSAFVRIRNHLSYQKNLFSSNFLECVFVIMQQLPLLRSENETVDFGRRCREHHGPPAWSDGAELPVLTQPGLGVTTTTVTSITQTGGDWSTGLFDVCNDVGTCKSKPGGKTFQCWCVWSTDGFIGADAAAGGSKVWSCLTEMWTHNLFHL